MEQVKTDIFISYRKDDTDADAENIFHHLRNAFGNVIFKDNMRIAPGHLWDNEILTHLEAAQVVLVLVGKNWFLQDDDHCIRLENEEDWVRKEVEYSIEKKKEIIPVLINGATPPCFAINNYSFTNPVFIAYLTRYLSFG